MMNPQFTAYDTSKFWFVYVTSKEIKTRNHKVVIRLSRAMSNTEYTICFHQRKLNAHRPIEFLMVLFKC